MMNIYVVECWMDHQYEDADGTMSYETNVAFNASTLQRALKFCKEHADYGGYENNWEFRIYRRVLDEDMYSTVDFTDDLLETIRPNDEEHELLDRLDEFLKTLSSKQRAVLKELIEEQDNE